MSIAPYRRVLAVAQTRRILLIAFLLRIPIMGAGVLLTLHVTGSLGRSWTDAGLVSGAATVAIAVSGPWRGRLLDRIGLRRVVLPSMLVSGACWAVAPFVGYWELLGLATVAGLFVVPTFSIIRQALIVAVPESDRRTVLSLDGVVVELSFMVGPLLGVWLTTLVPTRWVLFGIEMISVVVAGVLWWMNPPLRSAESDLADAVADALPRRAWFGPGFLGVCAAAAAATVVLTGSDVGVVAALQEWDAVPQLGLVLLLWGLGSIVGGLLYGAMSRPLPPFLLLAGLSATTVPMAFASSVWALAGLSFVAGLLCAPTVTSTVDAVSRIVPQAARGEAMGWHGSFMTAGSAIGAPLGGVFIDRAGFGGGFVSVSVIGLAVALAGLWTVRLRRRLRRRLALAA
ncbi:MFS transporter [Luteipulveratus sp. YIM 133132]|uniref:MFS transporter n=1 Tax=Luteipulveratus flavus TaxID=3031728 RepID=UPI0023AEB23A|nr:MFS transporter [Luteipulveratus sp. YIM 133132]MDE9367460.1 MFS transporter [Luteipulveratus sp. YIM 133132]